MNDPNSILSDFQRAVSSQISLYQEGIGRFRVFTPFQFGDGDRLVVVLEKRNGSWVLTDLGHTFMHLSYVISFNDIVKGTRQKILSSVISSHGLVERDGEIYIDVPNSDFGNALYTLTQGLLKINDIRYLTRERVLSTFLDDFREFISATVPEDRRAFDWFEKARDPQGIYAVDCKINGMPRPLMVFALNNDESTRDATITLHQFERWGLTHSSLGIFEDQESINRKVLARYTDVGEKQFSSLTGNKDRIAKFLESLV